MAAFTVAHIVPPRLLCAVLLHSIEQANKFWTFITSQQIRNSGTFRYINNAGLNGDGAPFVFLWGLTETNIVSTAAMDGRLGYLREIILVCERDSEQ